MKVFHDVVTRQVQDDIESTLLHYTFPWYYTSGTSYSVSSSDAPDNVLKDVRTKDSSQFNHSFYNDRVTSNYWPIVHSLIEVVEELTGKSYQHRILRAKANLICRDSAFPDECYNMPHSDATFDGIESFLYYVNESDGDTVIFNEKPGAASLTECVRSSPEKGKLIVFDSYYLHSSSPPKHHDARLVINILFRK